MKNIITFIHKLSISFIFLFKFQLAEYHIDGEIIPSFLNASFFNLSDNVFPSDIMIKISLSRVAGTLLYSVDSNDNQLIVSLNDASTPTLDIEFGKVHTYVSISKLCRSDGCKYEALSLRLQMMESMHLQCNGGAIESYKYKRTKQFNIDYPIPKFPKSDKLSAYLWLINTPHIDSIYPNSAQLSGCIFDVMYDNTPLKMEAHGVGDKCNISCTKDICHTGQCFETYNSNPMCNCTASFNNGKNCNDEVISRNINVTQQLQFKAIKLSWKGASGQIFHLQNGHLTFNVSVNQSETRFITNTSSLRMEVTIFEGDIIGNDNILIMEFYETYMVLKSRSNNSPWSIIIIPQSEDLSRVTFVNLILESGNGTIDMVYKNDLKEIYWNKLDYTINTFTKLIKTDGHLTNRTGPLFLAIVDETTKGTVPKTMNIQQNPTPSVQATKNITNSEIESLNLKVDRIMILITVITILSISIWILLLILLVLLRRRIIKDRKKMKKCSEPLLERQTTTITTVSEETDNIIGGK